MNFKLVLKLAGYVLLLLGLSMLLPLGVCLIYGENPRPFLLSILCLLAAGFVLAFLSARRRFYAREGFFSVGLIWMLTCLGGALPFWFSGEFPSLIDCVFESFSGFTTTGATILVDIEAVSRGLLFWRGFTHWLGGMGVLVLATAVLPSLGIRSHYLTTAETPGPVSNKLVPRQAQSSKILYAIYCALTLAEILCLRLAGLPLYDAVVHAFSTAGTGGFSNRNGSVGAYQNPAAEIIIACFLLLFAINFTIHFLMLTRRFRVALASDELRFFLQLVALFTLLVTLNILPRFESVWQSVRYAFFQVASIVSTTGFSTADFTLWPHFSQLLLLVLMFCGGCTDSTSGGVKCSRVLLSVRCLRREINRIIHPRSVRVVKLDGKTVSEETLQTVLIYFATYFIILWSATLILSLDDFSFTTSFTAALTCVSNAGPGLEMVGPSGNFLAFSTFSKGMLCLCMVVGRLEIFPVLLLFSPNVWRRA